MVIDMGGPCSIQRDQPPGIDCPAEEVLWDKLALVPRDELFELVLDVLVVLACADLPEPLMIGVMGRAAMLEPLFDEHVCGFVVESGFDELRHVERWGRED